MFGRPTTLPAAEDALPGRAEAMTIEPTHAVLGTSMLEPYPDDCEKIIFGLGCFWGAERKFWTLDGVYTTAVGYSAGFTPNPSYREVCTGMTGHNEVVLVVYRPAESGPAGSGPAGSGLETLLKTFWESHNPTQGMRQGNDRGTQYRSGIYFFDERQRDAALASREAYQQKLRAAGYRAITTEIEAAGPFYFAEDYHQQYLHKNPDGYCGLGGCGVVY